MREASSRESLGRKLLLPLRTTYAGAGTVESVETVVVVVVIVVTVDLEEKY